MGWSNARAARSDLVRVSWDERWTGSGARARFELPLRTAILGRRWRTSVERAVKDDPAGAFTLRLSETVDDLGADPPPHILVVDSHGTGAVPSALSDGGGIVGWAAWPDRGAGQLVATAWDGGAPSARLRVAACSPAELPEIFAALIEQIAGGRPAGRLDTAIANAARHTLPRVRRGEEMDSSRATATSKARRKRLYRSADGCTFSTGILTTRYARRTGNVAPGVRATRPEVI